MRWWFLFLMVICSGCKTVNTATTVTDSELDKESEKIIEIRGTQTK